MGPLLFLAAGDLESRGLDPGEPDGSRGAALLDGLGKWGVLALMLGVGIAEVRTGRRLMRGREGDTPS